MAFLISVAHFFFCSFRALCVSCRSLIFCNKSLPPSTDEAGDPPALLGSEGARAGEEAAVDAASLPSDALSSAPEVRPSAASAMSQAHRQ